MVFVSTASSEQKWGNLGCDRGDFDQLAQECIICGGQHFTADHWEFLQTMPEDPVDMVDDLVRMGIYKENQLRVADRVNASELRKTLFLKTVGRGDPAREKLILALCEQAGGLDNRLYRK